MKRIFTYIRKQANRILLITILGGTMASCDTVLNFDEGDCTIEYYVKFIYDHNMDWEDYFARDVKTVTLYAFDANGNLAYQKTEEGEMLADGSYAMKVELDDLQYRFIAWAGLDDQSFGYPQLTPGVSKIDDLKVIAFRKTVTRAEGEEDMYIVEDVLSPLWHGEVTPIVETRSTTGTAKREYITIPLIKNTNTIRVNVVQRTASATRAITGSTFSYAIYDDNGHMNYDNTLLDDNLLTYLPYSPPQEGNILTTSYPDGRPGVTANLSVARLLTTQAPRISIKNSAGEEQFPDQLDLIPCIWEVWNEHYRNRMSFQEYLDREDEFEVDFFVDENLSMITTVIEINGWIVRLNTIDF
ncbi:FimB/Mfa2 family fimbrial subunit [Bacteroides sp. UBA939]|uniref:FimB/Mfa2 family fimbrial subunit n=1 Tax=Bacteroides sp. UBA939 TaxID=1946092 RepID=UPI0025C1D5EB|nr:FimB/Mfa2 family fimbrial subunit [Bacteroides sp. UBA939]